MRLYELFAEKGYHTSIATTFGLDFDAYESVVLSRLRGAGCRNNIVIADARMLNHALSGTFDLPRFAGTHYTVSGAASSGIFHPKLLLQFGRRRGRLILGSANLTPSGIAGNLEIVGKISYQGDDAGERQLIAQAWDYVARFVSDDQAATSLQRDWMTNRTSWLRETDLADGPVVLKDGTLAALFTSDPRTGIADRFANMINQPVKQLIVISPYWDRDLSALSHLAYRLEPEEIAVLIDPETREFPGHAADKLPSLKIYRRGNFREGRFIHAKVTIAISDDADHVLFGSANCTTAALGRDGFSGNNQEVSLYRCFPPNSVCTALGLTDVLTFDRLVPPSSLKPPEFTDEIPLKELARKNPGHFECRGDTLFWYFPAGKDPSSCSITLLDQHACRINCAIEPVANQIGPNRHYRIRSCDGQPAFARVVFSDGQLSSLAPVTLLEHLYTRIREPYPSRIQSRLAEFEDDTDASIGLLDLLTELESFERSHEKVNRPISIPRPKGDNGDAAATVEYRQLTYEEFIVGRRPRTSGGSTAYNSLAGSSVAIVREILNRILSPTEDGVQDIMEIDSNRHGDAFSLADETDDAEKALEEGAHFADSSVSNLRDKNDAERTRCYIVRRRATRNEFVRAVKLFQKRIRQRTEERSEIGNIDLIRLRTLLMVLCTAASPEPYQTIVASPSGSSIRVIPIEGDGNSWPVLIGRLLFQIFNPTNPAIRYLNLTDEHDQVPADFKECWATCYWCIQACLNAPCSEAERMRITAGLRSTAENCLRLTLPSPDELLGDEIMIMMQRMTNRFAKGLRIDESQILEGHRVFVARLFGLEGSSNSRHGL